MSPDEKLEYALQCKNRGNCHYMDDEHAMASDEYAKVCSG